MITRDGDRRAIHCGKKAMNVKLKSACSLAGFVV